VKEIFFLFCQNLQLAKVESVSSIVKDVIPGMVHANVCQTVIKSKIFNTFLDVQYQVVDATIYLSDA
jgi:hypothetical protein